MKMKTLDFAAAALACAPTALALATFTPISNGPTYSVGLPPGTKISSSSPGEIYFSLEAPDTYQWAGLGIGGQMAGATIFMMYQDGKGNVTISAREGDGGHVEPSFNSSLMSGVTLLEGSGVTGGKMRANVKCTTCSLDSEPTSKKSPWIAAHLPGSVVKTSDESANLDMHDLNSMYQFTFDLTAASLSSGANPFVTSVGKPSSPSATSGSPSGSPSGNPSGSPSGNPFDNGDGSSGSGSSFGGFGDFEMIPNYQRAHAVLMGTSVLLLFPIGAVFMRLVGSPLIHGIVQVLALVILVAGFAVGVRMADILDILYKGIGRTHTIFGTVIVALFIVQPFIGLTHHILYKRTGGRTSVSHIHTWLGRSILICGAVNGGLGLQLAANSRSGEIAWGVVAGVVALIYALAVVLKRKSGRSLVGGRKGEAI